ncbi:hypothetical protein LCO01nite_15100 [Lapidilactobacillus concavus]|nr:MerR family transcriptional regulator [Lapidilactobacillus concavus]GEL13961.1 hypothetical protein LCO01nite_15100 [Lapidilactobacillus concavus]
MNYRTSELAKLAGVSQRTIRFYENEGLLVAQRDPQNQYRYFGTDQVDRLQQILFYRQLGLPISQVKKMMLASDYEIVATLQQQRSALEQQRAQLDQMLQLIDDTIRYQKGDLEMTDEEKFQAFKEASLQENEEKYGEEIREQYGEEVVEKANHQWISQASNNFKRFQAIENDLFKQLAIVAQTHDLESDAATAVSVMANKEDRDADDYTYVESEPWDNVTEIKLYDEDSDKLVDTYRYDKKNDILAKYDDATSKFVEVK